MAFEPYDVAAGVPPWRGFHHVALVTPDLDATIRFYGDVLGMRVGEVIGATEQQGRHCFIKPGDDSETWGLHFFERPDAEVFAYPETFERYAFVPRALQLWPSPCRTKLQPSPSGGDLPRSVWR